MQFFKSIKAKMTGQSAAPLDDLPLAFAKLMAAFEAEDYPGLLAAANALLDRNDLPPASGPNVLRLRARARLETADATGAVADYTKLLAGGLAAVNEGLRAETLAYFGVALFKTGQLDAATARFDEATALEPGDAGITALRAGCAGAG